MTERTCVEPNCKRAPAYPDQARCAEHRLAWKPEWLRRAEKKPLGLARILSEA